MIFLSFTLLFLSNVLLSHQQYYQGTYGHRILYQWIFPEYIYPTEAARDEAIQRGEYNPVNVCINDVDYYAPTGRYFVAAPLFREGIPASVSEVVSDNEGRGFLKPFPGWSANYNNEYSCFGPLSVYRIWIDKCGLLWVLDSGRSDIINVGTQTCTPKLLIYDLNYEDRLVLRYEFPAGVYTDRSYLITIITESYRSDCSDSIAYIADTNDHGLIVFDFATVTSWRIDNKYFYPYPTDFEVYSNGVVFHIVDGIFGLALGPGSELDRKLYFHSFASVRESWVPVSVLKNQTVAQNPEVARTAFVLSPGERAGQSESQAMTDDGILIYSVIPLNAIACWNSRTPFTIENQHILERDDVDFQYVSGIKLKNNQLFLSSSRFQNYVLGLANNTDVKYRLMVVDDVKSWLANSPCSSGFGGAPYEAGSFGTGPYSGSAANYGSYGNAYEGFPPYGSYYRSIGGSSGSAVSYGSSSDSSGVTANPWYSEGYSRR